MVGNRFSELESYDRLFNSAIVNLLLKTNRGKGRDRKPNFVACNASIVDRWVVVS